MKVVITGAASGIGLETAKLFLEHGCEVHGIDILDSDLSHCCYKHYRKDVSDGYYLPNIEDVDILINNAGVQNSGRDIEVNLKGLINTTKKYGLQQNIKAIVNLASVSAHNGCEFGEYCASKGGVLSYTRWTAKEIAKWGATCNSISFGGVLTDLNLQIINDPEKWEKVMYETPLRKWATAEEAAQWIYFVAVQNKSMSGQDIIIDNLEMLNHTFIW